MKILIVEDETKVANFIQQALEGASMTVDAVNTYSDCLTRLKIAQYDVLILDRLVGKVDLVNNLAKIKQEAPSSNILVLSALSDVDDKVEGLTEGADDYLAKPFHISELIARIRTLTRRPATKSTGKDTLLVFKDLKIDLETQRISRKEKRIDLTSKEYRLLCLLARHPGRVFSKMDLLDQVWDMNHFPESNVVEVTIASLRSKIDKDFDPLIHSRRGSGYWLGEP